MSRSSRKSPPSKAYPELKVIPQDARWPPRWPCANAGGGVSRRCSRHQGTAWIWRASRRKVAAQHAGTTLGLIAASTRLLDLTREPSGPHPRSGWFRGSSWTGIRRPQLPRPFLGKGILTGGSQAHSGEVAVPHWRWKQHNDGPDPDTCEHNWRLRDVTMALPVPTSARCATGAACCTWTDRTRSPAR